MSLALENAIFWRPKEDKINKKAVAVISAGDIPRPLCGCWNHWALQQGIGLLLCCLGMLVPAPRHRGAALSLSKPGSASITGV